jgi:uncharacterized protein (TIGR03000 family)
MTVKKSLLAAIVAISAVGMMTQSSSAFFGWRGGSSGGSWGSRGSHGSWGGSWGSRGSHGSWGGSHGSWGGSHGSWGGSHGSWGGGSHGSWGGSYGSHGSYGGVYYSDGGYARTRVVHEGVVVARSASPTKVIASKPAVKTSLTLHVPAEAKVTLAGVSTKQTGEVRQFATTKLAAGQVWNDYKVVVEMQKDGQMVREERTLKLTGGQTQELTVNVDSNQIAQR